MDNHINPENINIEDAFMVGDDDWITLPGNQGKISPKGIVYDRHGEPMYSIYEDGEAPLNIYLQDDEEYEWI